MKKDDLEKALEEIQAWRQAEQIRQEIAKGIRIRCMAFWSGMIGLFGLIGAWCAEHSKPVKGGLDAFWKLLWQSN